MHGGEVGYLLHDLQGLDVVAGADIAVVFLTEGVEACHCLASFLSGRRSAM